MKSIPITPFSSAFGLSSYRVVQRQAVVLRTKSGRVVEESFAGTASLELQYLDTGCYQVCQTGEDGYVSEHLWRVKQACT